MREPPWAVRAGKPDFSYSGRLFTLHIPRAGEKFFAKSTVHNFIQLLSVALEMGAEAHLKVRLQSPV